MRRYIYDQNFTQLDTESRSIKGRLSHMAENGITDVLLAVWWNGPVWDNPTCWRQNPGPNVNIRAYAEEADRHGIRVHGYWLAGLRMGGSIIDEFVWPGTPERFWTWHSSSWREWMLDCMQEFERRYGDVMAGISLDYTRTGSRPAFDALYKEETALDMQACYLLNFWGAWYSEPEFVKRRLLNEHGIDLADAIGGNSREDIHRAMQVYRWWMREPVEALMYGIRELWSFISCYGTFTMEWDQGRYVYEWAERKLIDVAMPLSVNDETRNRELRFGKGSTPQGITQGPPVKARTVPVVRLWKGEQEPKLDAELKAEHELLARTYGHSDLCYYVYSNREHVFL